MCALYSPTASKLKCWIATDARNASEPFDSAIDMGWSWLPNEDFALCDECHQDLVDIGQDVITNLLAGDAAPDKRLL